MQWNLLEELKDGQPSLVLVIVHIHFFGIVIVFRVPDQFWIEELVVELCPCLHNILHIIKLYIEDVQSHLNVL